MIKQPENIYSLVCFGEILWDYSGGRPISGSGPLQVAYHLAKLGQPPALLSRVGIDPEGEKLFQFMEACQIPTEYVQVDYHLPTGQSMTGAQEPSAGQADILMPAAWDHIEWEEAFEPLIKKARYLVFSSLIARSETSRNTLMRLREMAPARVLDLRLQAPYYNRKNLEILLCGLSLLQLSLPELELITGWFSDYKNETDRIRILQDRFGIPRILVSMGPQGSLLNAEGRIYSERRFPLLAANGSAEAALAAFLANWMQGGKAAESLQYSCALGALVAASHSPCPTYELGEIDRMLHRPSD